jgi:hypothetical protein
MLIVSTVRADISSGHKRVSATIVAIVFALLVVPPLVRAAGALAPNDNSAPLLRLNRGVDVPESKCRVIDTSDHVAIFDAHTAQEIQWFERTVFQRCSTEPLPEASRRPPSVLRGPPLHP